MDTPQELMRLIECGRGTKGPTGHIKWDLRFMALSSLVSTWSKDPGRKVGAVVVCEGREVVSMGYNGLPSGEDDVMLELRPKSEFIHAEVNALARAGSASRGSTLYVTSHPCVHCAQAIVAHGVARVVCPPPSADGSKWALLQREGAELFKRAGVRLSVRDLP